MFIVTKLKKRLSQNSKNINVIYENYIYSFPVLHCKILNNSKI